MTIELNLEHGESAHINKSQEVLLTGLEVEDGPIGSDGSVGDGSSSSDVLVVLDEVNKRRIRNRLRSSRVVL